MEKIKNIQQMWDAAIQHQKAGDFDTDAMYDIFKRMDARLTFGDIANVLSGVYADTYWKGTYMDPPTMAKNMVQALGIDYDLALGYAQNAMALWRGIFSRKNFSDSGTIPTIGSYTASIDVVCNQNTPIPNTDQLITDWNTEFWKTPQVSKNYIYVRCQNLNFKGDITNQKIQIFYTEAGFNSPPTSWIQMLTDGQESRYGEILLLGGKSGPMGEGVRGVSEAFTFIPKTTSHLCITAAVTSDFFATNDPLKCRENWDTARWITHNGAAAWRNVDPQKTQETSLKFYNQDSRPEKFAFEAHCRNVPQGTEVALKCNDPSLACFDSCVNITQDYQLVGTEAVVPAHYQGDLAVTIKTPQGGLLPEGASVEVRMVWLLEQNHRRYLEASDMLGVNDAARASRVIKVPMGSFTLVGTK